MRTFDRTAVAFVGVWSFAAVLAILGHIQLVPGRLKVADLVDVRSTDDAGRVASTE